MEPAEDRKYCKYYQTPEQREAANIRAKQHFKDNRYELNRKHAIMRLKTGCKVSKKVLEKYNIDPTEYKQEETPSVNAVPPPMFQTAGYLWIPIPIPMKAH